LWEVLAREASTDSRQLIDAARLEIWEHVTFWDDVYSAIRRPAAQWAARAAGQAE